MDLAVVEVHEHNKQLSNEYFEYLTLSPFSFSRKTIQGTGKVWTSNPLGFIGQGSITLTAIN